MTAGRGFIALTIVIFGRWRPLGVLGAALFFGLASALQFRLQARGLALPYPVFLMFPYAVTLPCWRSRRGAPAPPATSAGPMRARPAKPGKLAAAGRQEERAMETRRVEAERLKEFAKRVFGTMQGAVTAGMIHLGDRLGLYRALAEAPATSGELAERTGLDERWLREWLRQQGAAGLLGFDAAERFSLAPEGVAVLADERHPAFGCGAFCQLPQTMAILDRLPGGVRLGARAPLRRLRARGSARRRARLRALVPDLPGARSRSRGSRA